MKYTIPKKKIYFIIFYLHDIIAPKSSSIVVGNVLSTGKSFFNNCRAYLTVRGFILELKITSAISRIACLRVIFDSVYKGISTIFYIKTTNTNNWLKSYFKLKTIIFDLDNLKQRTDLTWFWLFDEVLLSLFICDVGFSFVAILLMNFFSNQS